MKATPVVIAALVGGLAIGLLLAPHIGLTGEHSRSVQTGGRSITFFREDTSPKQTKFTTEAYAKVNQEARIRQLIEPEIPRLSEIGYSSLIIFPCSKDGFGAYLAYLSDETLTEVEVEKARMIVWNRLLVLSGQNTKQNSEPNQTIHPTTL